jgi:hypothetical protein
MSFSLVQVEVDAAGNVSTTKVVQAGFYCPADAMALANRLAQVEEDYGFNIEHDYWWFHRDRKHYRLIVRASSSMAPELQRS